MTHPTFRIFRTLVSITLVAIFIVLLGILTSCQTPGHELDQHGTTGNVRVFQDPEFEREIQYLEYILDVKLKRTIISFNFPEGKEFDMGPFEDGSTILGVCFPDLNAVTINEDKWDGLKKYTKYALIIHEILHCAYGIRHRTDRIAVMNPYIPSEKTLISQWPFIIAEIKTYPNINHPYVLDSMLPISANQSNNEEMFICPMH